MDPLHQRDDSSHAVPNAVAWHITFRRLVEEARAKHVRVPELLAALDVIDLGARHLPTVLRITEQYDPALLRRDMSPDMSLYPGGVP